MKELVSSTFSTELETILAFLPGYLERVETSSVLVKIWGCYSVSMKCPSTGLQTNLSFYVMENLFAGRGEMSKVYDIKGIPTRRAKEDVKTLFDGEYVSISSRHVR